MKTISLFLFQCLLAGILYSQGASLPYSTGFDSASEKSGWQQFRSGNDPGAFQWNYSGGAFSAPTCLSHDYNVGGGNTDTVIDWFVSPPLNITSSTTMSLKVYTGGFSTPFADNCEIWFGMDDPNPTTGNFVLLSNLSYMQPQYQWLDTLITIPYIADSGYIAIKYKTIGAAWSTYSIDNITVSSSALISETNFVKGELEIFPNPFSSQTILQTNDSFHNAVLTVQNSFGQIVVQMKNLNGKTIIFDRNKLSSGVYFIQLTEENKTITITKLIITDSDK